MNPDDFRIRLFDKETGEEIKVEYGPWNGFEIREDGDVFLTEDGVRRKANRLEAIETRQVARWAIGEDIADAAGIEPE